MAKKTYDLTNCYTAPQTAQVLGLSTKRVRQLLQEGKLTKVSDNPVLIEQLEVNQLRIERQALGKSALPRTKREDKSIEMILDLLKGMEENNRKMLETIAESNKVKEENYLEMINRLKAENESLLEQLSARRKGFFSRK